MKLPKVSLFAAILCAIFSLDVHAFQDRDQWPQWRGPDRDGILREADLIKKFPEDGLELLWKKPISAGYCGPTVSRKRVFVTDRVTKPAQMERIWCLDSRNGTVLWKDQYECSYRGVSYTAGPRASVTVEDNRAFVLGTMGHLRCYDVGGLLLWKKDLNKEYQVSKSRRMPIWGIAASPIIYRRLVTVVIGGDNGACVVALDKKTGEEKWRALNDRPHYSSPILIQQAGRDVLVVWTGDAVNGLDPSTGKSYWRFPFPAKRMPIGVATPVFKDGKLFITSFYDGSLILKVHSDEMKVSKIWQKAGPNERRTKALHSMISTPVWIGDYLYGVDSYGELRCLEALTGKRIWEDQSAVRKARWSNIHFTQFPNKDSETCWMFNEQGELILGELKPDGFSEVERTKLIDPTTEQLRQRGGVCWAHPAFSERSIIVRNDKEIRCYSLKPGQR